MKLLTHNLLQCPLSGTYPLKIVPAQVERLETEFRQEVMVNMLPKLEWSVLLEAAADVRLPRCSRPAPLARRAQHAAPSALAASGVDTAAPAQVGFEGLPESAPEDAAENLEFLQLLHSCILDTHVINGELVSQTGRRYPIADSIPNMLLQDVRKPGSAPLCLPLAQRHVTTIY